MEIIPELLSETLSLDITATIDPFLTSDMAMRNAKMLWLKNSLIKKWEPASSQDLEAKAITLWREMNAHCATWEIPDGSEYVDDIIFHAKDSLIPMLLKSDNLSSRVTWDDALQYASHGRGKSRGVEYTAYYFKQFSADITTTSNGLYKHYVNKISSSWLAAERSRLAVGYGVKQLSGSSLSTVRKNASIDRTVDTQPSLNMFYQLGVGKILRGVLKKNFGIDLAVQPMINRLMAKLGSIDGENCTIDLKSASDTIATLFVKWYFPQYTFNVLDSLRCKETVYKGEKIRLDMFTSMGNGFTFPLQTLIFASLLKATYTMLGVKTENGKNFAVFGDDIICNKQVYHVFLKVLKRCGFLVNEDKSFASGGFRESCGADYFRGQNIRGVYIRRLNEAAHVYSSFNRIARWSVRNGISVPNLLLHLKGLADFRPVPLDESDDAGIKTPRACVTNRKRCKSTGAEYYSCLTPLITSVGNADAKVRNPGGAVICAVGGFLRDNRLHLCKSNEEETPVAYKIIQRKSSSWDFLPYVGLTIQDYERLFMIDLHTL